MAHRILISYPGGARSSRGVSRKSARARGGRARPQGRWARGAHANDEMLTCDPVDKLALIELARPNLPSRAHLVRDRIYLAERTWSETETTANGGPPCGQRPGHQIGSPASSPNAASPPIFLRPLRRLHAPVALEHHGQARVALEGDVDRVALLTGMLARVPACLLACLLSCSLRLR